MMVHLNRNAIVSTSLLNKSLLLLGLPCYQFFFIYCPITLHCLLPYVHIYCHPQTDCFVVSQLFSVARHAGRFKLGSKPAQLYVRLSILQLSHQVTYVSSGYIYIYVYIYIYIYIMLSITDTYPVVQIIITWINGQ